MLAGINNYLYLWELVPIIFALATWILFGPYLLRWAYRKRFPAMPLTIARSTVAVFLAGLAGGIAGGVMFMLPSSLGSHLDTDLSILGVILAVPATLLVAYAVIYAMFDQPAGALIKVLIVPLAGVLIPVAAIAGASIPVAIMQKRARDDRNICTSRLKRLYEALGMYRDQRGVLPASLAELVDAGYITSSHLVCPARGGRETGYFYLRRAMSDTPSDQGILACDLRGNHNDGRRVLFANGDCYPCSEAEFQELLQLPTNAAVAQGLAAIEAR